MKYMIMHYASQADIDAMAGKETAAGPAWTPEEARAMGEFMGRRTDELVESGEFVDAAGLAARPISVARSGPGSRSGRSERSRRSGRAAGR
jgi:hypothetical protein